MENFFAIGDHTPDELSTLLDLAVQLKKEQKAGGNKPALKGKAMAMVFQKPSLRTRVSFELAMKQLGGDALYLSPFEIGLGKRESVADIARVFPGLHTLNFEFAGTYGETSARANALADGNYRAQVAWAKEPHLKISDFR